MELARTLLEYGADASLEDRNKLTSLHIALQCSCHTISTHLPPWTSSCKHIEIAQVHLEHGADANIDIFGSTPLHLASRRGHEELARVLLEHGADLNAQDKDDLTPLQLALRCTCHIEPPRIPTPEYWRSSSPELPAPSSCKHLEVAQVLLEHGADANIQYIFGSTPLHLASQGGHVEFAQALLEHGADLNAQDKDNLTPLQLAFRCLCKYSLLSCKHSKVAQVLLKCGAHVNVEDIPLWIKFEEGEDNFPNFSV